MHVSQLNDVYFYFILFADIYPGQMMGGIPGKMNPGPMGVAPMPPQQPYGTGAGGSMGMMHSGGVGPRFGSGGGMAGSNSSGMLPVGGAHGMMGTGPNMGPDMMGRSVSGVGQGSLPMQGMVRGPVMVRGPMPGQNMPIGGPVDVVPGGGPGLNVGPSGNTADGHTGGPGIMGPIGNSQTMPGSSGIGTGSTQNVGSGQGIGQGMPGTHVNQQVMPPGHIGPQSMAPLGSQGMPPHMGQPGMPPGATAGMPPMGQQGMPPMAQPGMSQMIGHPGMPSGAMPQSVMGELQPGMTAGHMAVRGMTGNPMGLQGSSVGVSGGPMGGPGIAGGMMGPGLMSSSSGPTGPVSGPMGSAIGPMGQNAGLVTPSSGSIVPNAGPMVAPGMMGGASMSGGQMIGGPSMMGPGSDGITMAGPNTPGGQGLLTRKLPLTAGAGGNPVAGPDGRIQTEMAGSGGMMGDGASSAGLEPENVGNVMLSGSTPSVGDSVPGDVGSRQPPSQQQVPPVIMTPTQMTQLRAQIMAYRFLSRNQPLPDQLRLAIEGKRPYGTPLFLQYCGSQS
jgi:hypothetical protein